MTALKTKSEMQTGNSSSIVWTLKNWKNLHKLLACQADCILQVDDVQLRFFLRFSKDVSNDYQERRDTIVERYSLNVQLLSYHKKASVKVVTKYNRLEAGQTREITKESYVFVEKSTKDYIGTEVVDPEFYKFGIWNKSYKYTESWLTDDWRKNYSETLDDLDIEITVTLLKFVHEGDTQSIEINARKEVLPKVQNFLQANEQNPFAEIISLKMKDGVVLLGHRLILAGASPVFEAMLTSDFLETQSKSVQIEDITSEVMKVLLWYMYTGEIDPSCDKLVDQVIYGASKYQLDGLLEYFDNSLMKLCTPGNIFAMMALANKYNLVNAKGELTKYVETNSLEIVMNQLNGSSLDNKSKSICELKSDESKPETLENQAVYLQNRQPVRPGIFFNDAVFICDAQLPNLFKITNIFVLCLYFT